MSLVLRNARQAPTKQHKKQKKKRSEPFQMGSETFCIPPSAAQKRAHATEDDALPETKLPTYPVIAGRSIEAMSSCILNLPQIALFHWLAQGEGPAKSGPHCQTKLHHVVPWRVQSLDSEAMPWLILESLAMTPMTIRSSIKTMLSMTICGNRFWKCKSAR